MGANIELDIFLKKENFSLKPIFSLLEMEGLHASIKEMSFFDDWKYTNETSIDPKSIDINTSTIFLKKFTRIYFIVNNTWRCTLLTSLEDDMCINLSFGLDTDDWIYSGVKDIEGFTVLIYDRVADIINDNIDKNEFKEYFIVASLGEEYAVIFNSDIIGMFNKNEGVDRWILPKATGKHVFLRNYIKEEKSNIIVLKFR